MGLMKEAIKLSKKSHLVIRFALHGCGNRPFYHIVLQRSRKPRDQRPLEQLGTYDPLPNQSNECLVALNFDRLQHWIGYGVEISKPVEQLISLSGYFPVHPMNVIDAKRAREEAAKKSEDEARVAESTNDAESVS